MGSKYPESRFACKIRPLTNRIPSLSPVRTIRGERARLDQRWIRNRYRSLSKGEIEVSPPRPIQEGRNPARKWDIAKSVQGSAATTTTRKISGPVITFRSAGSYLFPREKFDRESDGYGVAVETQGEGKFSREFQLTLCTSLCAN